MLVIHLNPPQSILMLLLNGVYLKIVTKNDEQDYVF